ncbi:hypothetical protein HYW11_02265 [Candidatus Peregrinibacteria bacterium]|nr:hypothetical protein [Candidatus Peregrinibacteria bacterium]
MSEGRRHHNVPRSRGGTRKKSNISIVHPGRHKQFHMWAWNYPPDSVLRLMAIHAVRIPGQSLPPSALEDFLSTLTDVPWEEFYEPDAMNGGVTKKHRRKAAYFREQHVFDEEDDAHHVIGGLLLQESFPADRHTFFQQALLFFGTSAPREALERFLTEVFHGQELAWTKAFRAHVRSKVQDILLSATPMTLSPIDEQCVVDILTAHKQRLHQWAS